MVINRMPTERKGEVTKRWTPIWERKKMKGKDRLAVHTDEGARRERSIY